MVHIHQQRLAGRTECYLCISNCNKSLNLLLFNNICVLRITPCMRKKGYFKEELSACYDKVWYHSYKQCQYFSAAKMTFKLVFGVNVMNHLISHHYHRSNMSAKLFKNPIMHNEVKERTKVQTGHEILITFLCKLDIFDKTDMYRWWIVSPCIT